MNLFPFKVLTLNVRGLFRSADLLFDLVDRDYDVAFIQETLVSNHKVISALSSRWGGSSYWSPALGKQGGVCVIFNKHFEGDILTWRKDSSGRVLSLVVDCHGCRINFLNVYAPTNPSERKAFFENLHEFFLLRDNIVLCGDFNCYESELDKFGGNANVTKHLSDVKSAFSLTDIWRKLHPRVCEFTWFNSDLSLASRLDKFYVSISLIDLCLSCSISPCHFSDHEFVSLEFNFSNFAPRGPGFWKFNNSLLDDDSFCAYMSDRISDLSNCISRFQSVRFWWDFFKRSIKADCISFSREKRRVLNRERVVLTNRLIVCKQLLVRGDSSVKPEIISLEAQLSALAQRELEGVKVRSRARWIEEGEKPTRFFFKLEQERAKKSRVSSIYDPDGNEVFSRSELEKAHVDFYRALFAPGEIDASCQAHLFSQVHAKLTSDESFSCEGPVSLEELTAAVKSLPLNKSPGPDGFTPEFYLKFWSLLAPLLLLLFNLCFDDQHLPESMQISVTRLLYKKRGDIKDLKNWRPISLLNVDYKILSKAITLRLSRVMSSLVDPDQTCSVPGRSITSNVNLLRDVLDYIERTNEAGILVSLDQEKAFDRVDRSFLMALLRHFGFGADFLSWIRTLYAGAAMKIILNGWFTEKIYLERGVRQGDPLSPLLYVLCVEVLACVIRMSPFLTGFLLPGASGLHFRVRQYADDTTAFVKNLPSLVQLFNVVALYERGSGAKLNRAKTEAMWLGAWRSRADEPLGLTWVKKMKILGVWFGVVSVDRDNWLPRVEKLEKSINMWKSRSLSFVGKALVINVVGLTKFYYLARVLMVPEWVLSRVNALIWPFLWGSKMETVARKKFFCPISDGGIGLVNLLAKCDSLRVSSLLSSIEATNDKSFYLCKYFVGWQMARLHPMWSSFRDNFSPGSFELTRFYSSCLSVLSHVDLNSSPLSAKYLYTSLNTVQMVLPRVHRAWTPFPGPRILSARSLGEGQGSK